MTKFGRLLLFWLFIISASIVTSSTLMNPGGSGGAATSLTIGTTTLSSGTDTRVLFDDGGVVGEDAGLVYAKATDLLTAGKIYLNNSTVILKFIDTDITTIRDFSAQDANLGTTISGYINNGTSGGLIVRATTTNSSATALTLDGWSGQTTVQSPAILLRGLKSNGTSSIADMSGTEQILEIAGNASGVHNFIFNAEGSLYMAGSGASIRLEDTDISSIPFTTTGITANTVFAAFTSGGGGGQILRGFTNSTESAYPIVLDGFTGDSTPTVAPVLIRALKTNGGTGATALASTEKEVEFSGGNTSVFIYGSGRIEAPLYSTTTNCSDSAGDAACSAAPSGSVVVDAADTTTVVSTTAVTADSQILLQVDSSLGTRLSVTCNTQDPGTFDARVTARSAGASFTITVDTGPTTNPLCLSYTIVN